MDSLDLDYEFDYMDYVYDESIDYTNNLELIEDQLIILNENIVEGYASIVTNSINTLEVIIIFLGVLIGILLSLIFGVVAFSD